MSPLAATSGYAGASPAGEGRITWAWELAQRRVASRRAAFGARVSPSVVSFSGAVAVAVSAIIHLHLWMQGYKHIHLIGPLFLAQAIAGIGLAVVMVAYPRFVSAVAGALYMASTIGGLLMSATVGIFGFHDGLSVPWATSSLVIEAAGLVVLLAAGAAFFARR